MSVAVGEKPCTTNWKENIKIDSLTNLQVWQAIYTHNNTKIAEIDALYLHIISILYALFKAIFPNKYS